MRDQLSSLDVRRLVIELRSLVGARCKKTYQPHFEQLVLRLNPPGRRAIDVVVVRGRRIAVSRRDRPMPMQPPPFAMILRKHLANGRLVGVEQHGFDRILWLDFETKDGRRRLVIECFRDGNVILLDQEGTIIHPLTHARYADRTLLRGEPYELPPEPADPERMTAEALLEVTSASDRGLARTLAGRTGLSGPLANALCDAVGLDGNGPAATLDAAGAAAVLEQLQTWLRTVEGPVPDDLLAPEAEADKAIESGWLVLKEAATKAALEPLEGAEWQEALEAGMQEATPLLTTEADTARALPFPSLAGAIDAWWGPHDSLALARREADRLAKLQGAEGHRPSDEGDKLERRRAGQLKALERFETEAAELQELAQGIEGAWDVVTGLLEQVNQGVDRVGWDGLEGQLSGQAWVTKLHPADRAFEARLPAEDGSPTGPVVRLQLDDPVHRNAKRYYDDARRLKDKATGARAAIEDTKTAEHRTAKKKRKAAERGVLQTMPRSRKLWFERYRWSVVDGGRILIGGRDAKSNDALVRKHLASHDRYVHADLHGAPSCSLRLRDGFATDEHPLVPPPEGVLALRLVQDLEGEVPSDEATTQAAQLALAWSRAWAAGSGGGQAYWVRPSQVSKQTETGEALARGAFVVRGQRTWFNDLPLELAVAPALVNGIPLLVSGTRDAIEALAATIEPPARWALLGPGRGRKEPLANKLREVTGISVDDILGVLPGACEVKEDHGLFDRPKPRAGATDPTEEE